MNRSLAAIGLAAVLCCGSAASAQESAKLGAQPAEIDKEGITKGDLARRTIDAFGACIVHRHRNQALQWLSLEPGDPTVARKAYGLADDDCLLNGEIMFDSRLFRGALYKALYHEQFGRKAPLPNPVSDTSGAVSADAPFAFADCVARRDPTTVRSVVLASAGSNQENEAIAALAPQFSLCLTKGSQLTLGKSTLVSLLAEALYRASTALTPGVAAGGTH